MNYVEFIRQQTYISVSFAIELMTPMFLRAQQWDMHDDIAKLRSDAEKFIADTIKSNREFLNGHFVPSDPGMYDRDKSMVDCKKLLELFHVNFISKRYVIPTELEEMLGITQQKESNHSQNANFSSDEEPPQSITKMTIPALRKKVAELANEKDKWDKSIVAAAKIGLLFYEKGLSKPTTEKEFVAEFSKEFDDLPKTTISKIYRSLPPEYRNKGGSPQKEASGIDDDTIDTIIEAAVAAGLIIGGEEVKDAKDLSQKLTRYEFEAPPEKYLRAISGACKRVHKKYEHAVE